jgi:5-formyltetrahydrofolate cyclo-ligase
VLRALQDARVDPAAAKLRLRSELRGRDHPVPADAAAAGERICFLLLAEPTIVRAARIALYAALADEISTRPLFEALVRIGRPCLFPRTLPTGLLAYSRVERFAELRPGRYGIAEPVTASEEGLNEADVVIVPGLAFDRKGNRLGRGAGCYDRTFPPGGLRQPCLIGATYADRIVESLPRGSHDRVMDAIVTEQEFRWTRGGR